MHDIVACQENYLVTLAPRLYLGIWHIAFIAPARQIMPYAHLHHLSCSVAIARQHFWEMTGFNMSYAILKSKKGQDFMKECKAAGKLVHVWNLNETHQYFLDVLNWGLDGCTTDSPSLLYQMRQIYHHDNQALVKAVPWHTSIYRFWFLRNQARLDIKWHTKMLLTVLHPIQQHTNTLMDSTLTRQSSILPPPDYSSSPPSGSTTPILIEITGDEKDAELIQTMVEVREVLEQTNALVMIPTSVK